MKRLVAVEAMQVMDHMHTVQTLLLTSGDMDPDFALLLIDDDIYSSWNVFLCWMGQKFQCTNYLMRRSSPWWRAQKQSILMMIMHIVLEPLTGELDMEHHLRVHIGMFTGTRVEPREDPQAHHCFDDAQRIVGQLSGGSGSCGQGSDSYGKLYRALFPQQILKLGYAQEMRVLMQSMEFYTAGETEYITVTDPNGGETLESGGTFNITWDSNANSNVSIKLYINSTFNTNITTNTANDGSYNWNIPSSISQGSNYKIRVASTSNSNLDDYSDGTFSILSPSVDISIGNIDVNSGVY